MGDHALGPRALHNVDSPGVFARDGARSFRRHEPTDGATVGRPTVRLG